MKRVLKKLRIVHIEVFVYKMDNYVEFNTQNFQYKIEKSHLKNKTRYTITINNTLAHVSYLHDSVYLLRLLNKRGPVIGDCHTHKKSRGKSMYPYVINKIASENLNKGVEEVYIIVDQNNKSSIKGIEKAGFTRFASIKGARWLWFYLNKQINYFKIYN